MLSNIIWLIVFIIILWLVTMFLLWKKEQNIEVVDSINPKANKVFRKIRKFMFAIVRYSNRARNFITLIVTKIFLFVFPKARKALESKDPLTGLEQGPSSYFLKTISEKEEVKTKTRRKTKNV